MTNLNLTNRTYALALNLVFFSLVFGACKTQKVTSPDHFENDFFGIKAISCKEEANPQAIDSKVGTLECKDLSLNYDYGLYSYQGPITPKEEFRRTFDNYHHRKFFENRMIDPKVYKIFLDSVEVVDVRHKDLGDPLVIDCIPCNATAEITFLGETYFYPFTMSDQQLNMEGYEVVFVEKGDLTYKIYTDIDGNHGLYLSPKKNIFKKKNTLSLTVKDTSLDKDEINKILESTYLVH